MPERHSARYPSATRPDSWVARSVRSLVKIGIAGTSAVRLPAYPRKRTLRSVIAMSALCQKRTFHAVKAPKNLSGRKGADNIVALPGLGSR